MSAAAAPNPFALFETWFAEAQRTEPDDATAMSLATASPDGRPAVRMVLLKGADARGFVFYTHATSPKGRDLAANPRAALCFHWAKSERQVRIEGRVVNVPADEADTYFATRPRLSQIGAWASRQSEPASGRFELEQAVARESLRFGVGAVPRPPQWLGYRVVPDEMEFWHQRAFRHHDRQRFTRDGATWRMQWLFP
jgi:pyridoxamine 5'-phosphate oxidase